MRLIAESWLPKGACCSGSSRAPRAIFTYRHEAIVRAMALPTTPPPEIRLSR
jgi:hypothetical protein